VFPPQQKKTEDLTRYGFTRLNNYGLYSPGKLLLPKAPFRAHNVLHSVSFEIEECHQSGQTFSQDDPSGQKEQNAGAFLPDPHNCKCPA
jgi:hypothetical protein